MAALAVPAQSIVLVRRRVASTTSSVRNFASLHSTVYVDTITSVSSVQISFDSLKRELTLSERGLDFEDATMVFAGTTGEI